MSKYYIAYGMDTQTIEDPDQLVLVGCPEDWADLDNDDLVEHIDDAWDSGALDIQRLVGFTDVIDSMRLIIQGGVAGILSADRDRVEQEVVSALIDAMDNRP
jgi:hypothetical protein